MTIFLGKVCVKHPELQGEQRPDNLMVVPAAINLAKGARYNSTMEFLLS